MTDRYEKIRKALEMGPTPGPWKVGHQNDHCGISIRSNDDARVATAYLRLIASHAKWGEEHFVMPENRESVANAHLIAACDPDTIRALLDERDALGAENERRWEGNRRAAQEYVEDMRDVLKEAARICQDLDEEALAKEGRLACGAECAAAIAELAVRLGEGAEP